MRDVRKEVSELRHEPRRAGLIEMGEMQEDISTSA